MSKKRYILFVLISCTLLIQPHSQTADIDKGFINKFNKADSLFSGINGEYNDSLALSYFTAVAKGLKENATHAIMLFNCQERIGILQQGLGNSTAEILQHFYKAIQIQKSYQLSDSITFRLYLSIGNVHYSVGLFDSSVFYYTRAENVIDQYPNAGLAGDLYNSLGALYSEAGNYKQSSNYFSKALEITKQTRPELREAIFAMTMNIASALRLTGNYDAAIGVYNSLLNNTGNKTPLLNNLARIYIAKQQPDSALFFLKQIKDVNGQYAIAYNNSLAEAYLQLHNTDAAKQYLLLAEQIFTDNSKGARSIYFGTTCLLNGKLLLQLQQPEAALAYFQKAMIQLHSNFSDTSVYANPASYIGDFASYDLFEALIAKANCFAQLYQLHHSGKYAEAAIQTFQSAFNLADYIKKSIDNDEARLFMADKVFNAYKNAVAFIMQSGNDIVLTELALQWISKSRAAALAISLNENNIRQYAGLPDTLLQEEKNTRLSLSRLKRQMAQETDSATQQTIASQVNSAELLLNRIMNKYKDYPAYYEQKFAADSLNITAIQQNILDKNTAAICYFRTNDTLLAFVIKQTTINCIKLPQAGALQTQLALFSESLTEHVAGKNDASKISGTHLYNALIEPLVPIMSGIENLIIIPDQQLINIPFEAFIGPDHEYLVSHYAVTYQFALPFLHLDKQIANTTNSLALAPFANAKNNLHGYAALPSSAEEIAVFSVNDRLTNSNATRANFLNRVNNASVLHLATHAVVNFSNPADSYIAFYPSNNNDTAFKLFAHELYNLQLPNTHLVFLSACETGSGKISQSEGALSLTRAFAYAGCQNIITSLWKAEDKSTAYLSTRFYHYTNKGYTYARALQQAKIDLLNDAAMSQFHPAAYWSHLVFIGDVQPASNALIWWVMAAAIFAAAIGILYFVRKHRK
ncbi:CHAT domain-containing protein [Limnovirga soli]|uniref:CHAT domain-containing protein n=1 Tax=Limnovirga soli TaxID=2656915 RepID=A0A8J8FGG8_9BACT|nr:CHAT domain-containing protein [Limnovirga soli]NNV57463.1 CHAT domain-containing protein [Limnovirga soli]